MQYSLEHTTKKKVSAGDKQLLGATLSQGGVNFAIFSQYAQKVFLLLFESLDSAPTDIIELKKTDNVWHIFVYGIGAGQLYGYKVRGEYAPKEGMRFNEYKLLIDPYAKALTGDFTNKDNLLLAYDAGSPKKDLVMDKRDNTAIAPKSVVIDDDFDWQGDRPPNIPLERLIIYEVHAKGFTAHKTSGATHPGTYQGFIEKIPHLKKLGINAVEFLPVHAFYKRDGLIKKGLQEYWGYNSICFFAPEQSYSTCRSAQCAVEEFKILVRELHKAGMEVIIDVVYNHTAEGNELGPTLSFKGIDNPTYYALMQAAADEPYRYYRNDTGCGNTVNTEHPQVMKLILDSMRYWARFMRVDGFRFDLATVLTKLKGQFSHKSAFFEAVENDPVLKKKKMVAEPWDFTTYQVGRFPKGWSEWNGKFRDTMRKFNKGDAGHIKEVATRLTGSFDLYGDDGRKPYHSINFITCHDGFTLNDLYSYNEKHNEANLEDNRDGANDNNSWNCGAEGATENAEIITLRKQLMKNAFCLLLFSAGTPMIQGGDEMLRTQAGNNNVYCQDNEISWINWDFTKKHEDMLEFMRKAIAFRKRHAILRRKVFFTGKDTDGDKVPDITWFGVDLHPPVWADPEQRIICYQLDGSEEPSALGDYHLFLIFNADYKENRVRIPLHQGKRWYRIVDTSLQSGDDFMADDSGVVLEPQDSYGVQARSVVVLKSF